MRIEKGGKPVVLSAAPGFRAEIASHSQMDGVPYLQFVVLEVGQEAITLVGPAVDKQFDKMVKALTTPAAELMKKIPGEMV